MISKINKTHRLLGGENDKERMRDGRVGSGEVYGRGRRKRIFNYEALCVGRASTGHYDQFRTLKRESNMTDFKYLKSQR